MIIPIRPQDEKLRRIPWVTLVLLAANLAVFLVVCIPALHAESEQEQRLLAIYEYWKTRPYLDLPPEFMEDAISREQREQVALFIEQLKEPASRGAVVDQMFEQRKLDELIESYLAAASKSTFRELGLIPSQPSWLAVLTSMFVHAGWLHLIGNMLIFFITAPLIEDVYGRILFPIFYLASGAVAALGHIAGFPNSDIPLIGASGAIAGLMGAFLFRFGRTKIRFFYWFIFLVGTFSAPAWIMLVLWLAEQMFLASVVQLEGGVAYLAHIGGFAFGLVAAIVIGAFRIEEKYIHPKIEAKVSITQHPRLEEGIDLVAKGQLESARRAFAEVLHADPRQVDAHVAMWRSYLAEGLPQRGVAHVERAIEEQLHRGDADSAFDCWLEMVERADSPGSPALRWRLISQLLERNKAAAFQVLRNLAEDREAGPLRAKAASRLVTLAETQREKEFWQARATALAAEAGMPPTTGQVPAPRVHPATPSASPQAGVPQRPAATGDAAPAVERFGVVSISSEGLMLRDDQNNVEALAYAVIRSVVVTGITEPPRPYLVIDLVCASPAGGPLQVARLLSTDLDPGRLVGMPGATPMDAFRELVKSIATQASAEVLPSREVLLGGPIPTFPTLAEYERAVLAPVLGRNIVAADAVSDLRRSGRDGPTD